MVIHSMTATFGCLEQATLTFTQGLNLLEMPNESGKSTWCAFLRAMFYGLESRKGGALSERNRYTPWSGSGMNGSVTLTWQGKDLTLRRFPKGSNPFGGFQAMYTGTEEPVAGLTADNVGEIILGVTKEAFSRTCFVAQGGLHVDASGDLERRIAALAGAGEEDVSYSDAERRLRDWRNQRQSNRATGTLPKLRSQLSQTEAKRQRLLDAQARGREARQALEQLERDRLEVEDDLARHARKAEADRLADARAHYEKTAQRLGQAEEALMEAQTAEASAKNALPPMPGSGRGGQVALRLAMLLGCALVVCALVFALWPLIIGGVALLNIGALGNYSLAKARRASQSAYDQALARWEEAKKGLEAAQTQHIAARAAWEAVSQQGEPPAPPAVEHLPRRELTDDRQRLRRVQDSIALCKERLSRSQGEAEALGGLEPIEGEAAALEAAITREEGELEALNLALEALAEANAQLRTRFSPALNQKAGAILARLTGGRYESLTFTREFEILAQTKTGAKSAHLFSQGTADQAYLALRLAICALALPQRDPPPLILDDALVAFDDARLALALDVLQALAKERQVLLFTCQSRERLALANPARNGYNEGNIS